MSIWRPCFYLRVCYGAIQIVLLLLLLLLILRWFVVADIGGRYITNLTVIVSFEPIHIFIIDHLHKTEHRFTTEACEKHQ